MRLHKTPRSIAMPAKGRAMAVRDLVRCAAQVAAMVAVSASAAMAQAAAAAPEVAPKSVFGSYMAGRVARGDNDVLAAARFYRHTLGRDAANDQVLIQAFEMSATEGNWPVATQLAKDLVARNTDHRLVRTLVGLDAFKAGRFAEAEKSFEANTGNPVGDLTANLGRAWIKLAQGQAKDALDILDGARSNDSIMAFYRYHKALAADVAGRRGEARQAYERASRGGENKSLRFALAFAQHASNAGDNKLALATLQAQVDRARGDGHPLVRAFMKQIEAGERLPLIVATPSQGLAEAFFGLGEALMSEGSLGPGAIFLQYALFLEPQMPFALATLANVFEGAKKYELANAAYDRIPKGTPLDTSIEIRRALNLNALEKTNEAQRVLEEIAKREPTNILPLETLGNIMRGAKRFEEAVGYYTRAIALIPKPDARHWSYFYARGTSYERLKRWPAAEADLKTALKLSPEQAMVLNYLGYSWVDQGKNLKEGLQMIEKAVRLKPDDGYIIDSLGWAHFKLGNFKEAVKWLERAVELRPDDPVLNDHLGDGYWRVGREREARFQWEQALTLKPEAEDAEKIEKKLKSGLPSLSQARQPRPTRQVQGGEQPKKRTDAGAPVLNPVR